MNTSEVLKALDDALFTTRAQYDRMIASADRVLEIKRIEHSQTISFSAKVVGDLENQLETFEALEHDRHAAATRKDLATAVERHQMVVEEANRILREAIIAHSRSFAAAGIAFEAGFNAATSGVLSGS